MEHLFRLEDIISTQSNLYYSGMYHNPWGMGNQYSSPVGLGMYMPNYYHTPLQLPNSSIATCTITSETDRASPPLPSGDPPSNPPLPDSPFPAYQSD